MSKSISYKHYLRALTRWPTDPLRPETQLQDVLRRRIDRKFGITPAPGNSKAATPVDEKRELEQVNAIYSLLENRYSKKYPVAQTLLKPSSNPTYYTDLVEELAKAPTRTRWGSLMNRIKGVLRFK